MFINRVETHGADEVLEHLAKKEAGLESELAGFRF